MCKLKKLDYKWVIVFVCCLMVFTVLGFCSSANSMYISPITEALGISRGSYSVTTSVRYVATAVVNAFFGTLIYRLGAKKLIISGFVSVIVSQVIYSLAETVLAFSVGSMFLGIGLSFTTTTMVGAVVNNWCAKNKGTVMGIALASNGIGAALARNILAPIINSGDPFGYRTSYRLVVLILAAVMIVMIFFFRNEPKDETLTDSAPSSQKSRKEQGGREIFKKSYLYVALVCIFLTGLVLQSVSGIADPHFKDKGVDLALVTTVLSINSLALSGSKFTTGFIYDKLGIRAACGMCYAASVLAMLSLLFVGMAGVGTFFAFSYSILCAVALPLETIMLPIFAREIFGDEGFNRSLGLFVSVNTAGYALGGPAANLIYDLTNSYDIWIFAGMGIIAVTMLLMNCVITASRKDRMSINTSAQTISA